MVCTKTRCWEASLALRSRKLNSKAIVRLQLTYNDLQTYLNSKLLRGKSDECALRAKWIQVIWQYGGHRLSGLYCRVPCNKLKHFGSKWSRKCALWSSIEDIPIPVFRNMIRAVVRGTSILSSKELASLWNWGASKKGYGQCKCQQRKANLLRQEIKPVSQGQMVYAKHEETFWFTQGWSVQLQAIKKTYRYPGWPYILNIYNIGKRFVMCTLKDMLFWRDDNYALAAFFFGNVQLILDKTDTTWKARHWLHILSARCFRISLPHAVSEQ